MVVTKRQAIERVNSHVGRALLTGRNTIFASESESGLLWWLNVPVKKTCTALNVILKRGTRTQDGGFLWLKLPANTLSVKKFRHWEHRGAIDLGIGTQGVDYLRDTKSGGSRYDFSPHVDREFPA